MIFELAIVEDRGTYYLVTGVTKSSFDGLANREDKVLKLSYNSYQKISEALGANKKVTISKELMTDEVLPDEITISEDEVDDLDIYKKVTMQKINKKLSYFMTKLSSLDILSFTVINNELASKGYVITNDNREEQYIKIIETDDEKLIDKLEEYLIILDKVTSVIDFDNMCRTFLENIKNAKNTKEVDGILAKFYEKYDSSTD